jgi:hypothetical protein
VGITIDTFTDTCNTSTGNQTFTGSLDGLTPKAVMIHLTNCTALDTLTADAIECWGCATGTGANEEWCQSNWDDDGLGTSTTQRSNSLEDIVYVTDAADTVQAEANFVSFGANAVTINWATANWATAPPAAWTAVITLFAGSDLSAQAALYQMDATAAPTTYTVTNTGFEADVVFANVTNEHITLANGVSTAASSRGTRGFAYNDGATYPQACIAYSNQDGQTNTRASLGERDESIGVEYNNNLNVWTGRALFAIDNFTSSGFDIDVTVSDAESKEFCYLALAFGGVVDVGLITHTAPTTATNKSDTQLGFKPQSTSADNITRVGPVAATYAIGYHLDGESYSVNNQTQDQSGNSYSKTKITTGFLELPDDDGTANIIASDAVFDGDGFDADYRRRERLY